MTNSGPESRHDRASQQHEDDHESPGGHRLMMVACCIPMLVIAGVLVATGFAGSGVVIGAIVCTGAMAAMMFMMPGGRS